MTVERARLEAWIKRLKGEATIVNDAQWALDALDAAEQKAKAAWVELEDCRAKRADESTAALTRADALAAAVAVMPVVLVARDEAAAVTAVREAARAYRAVRPVSPQPLTPEAHAAMLDAQRATLLGQMDAR